MTHYDSPPPDRIEDLDVLAAADRFRFANELRAWVEVTDGRIVAHGHAGSGRIGSTTVGRGRASLTFPAVALADLQSTPEVASSSVRFVQTAGGRTALPAPRRVRHPPFVQVEAPLAWTTLALTINADGSSSGEMVGASPFPRHWLYDDQGRLMAKSGLIDYTSWYRDAFGSHTPWGDTDSPALVTEVESAAERSLSTTIMQGGAKPRIRKLKEGATLVEQGQPGTDLFLLLDGVLRVEVDGSAMTDLGPGALVGERALLEGGTRTATLRAVTACKVAVANAREVDPTALAEVSLGHRRESA
ncbi:MAG: cyclic nucleotide-binding domain-containing protein [Actinomycetota bacterium]|nr:cyclic nucleotide-binding domain-containing protein [Actinomycetota bacterium]